MLALYFIVYKVELLHLVYFYLIHGGHLRHFYALQNNHTATLYDSDMMVMVGL